jgi:hypothetical protein
MFWAYRPILRRIHTAVYTTIGSVSVPFRLRALYTVAGHNIKNTRPERYSHWTNGCVNSCVNSPVDAPVGPKHVEIRWYMNKIEIVTSWFFISYAEKMHGTKSLKFLKEYVSSLIWIRLEEIFLCFVMDCMWIHELKIYWRH